MVVLSDLIQRDQWDRSILMASIRKSVFWQSGVIVNDAQLTKFMNANVGSVFEWDYFLDLADDPVNISDDSNTLAVPNGIGTASSRMVGSYINQVWGTKTLTENLSSTGSPMQAISSRIGAYFARVYDFTVIAIVKGILDNNVVADASDMVNNQSGVPVDVNMFLDTFQTAGDASDMLGSIICHSQIITSLKKQAVTDRVYDSQGNFIYHALLGMRLTSNDNVPTGTDIPGGAAGDYMSYVVSGGIIGFGQGTPKVPTEIETNALDGNGAGSSVLVRREHFTLAPKGWSFLSTVMASTSPSLAEFEDQSNWRRDVERKRVGLAALICSA